VARQETPTSRASAPDSSSVVATLQDRLRTMPLLRSSMVDHALSLASNAKYPPDDLVDRIAALLGKHMSQ
jgi:hypothetical protein